MKPLNSRISYLVIVSLIVLFSSCGGNKTDDQIVFIENGKIALGFNKQTGSLSYLKNVSDSYNLLDTNLIPASPWEIDFAGSFWCGNSNNEKFLKFQVLKTRSPDPDPEVEKIFRSRKEEP